MTPLSVPVANQRPSPDQPRHQTEFSCSMTTLGHSSRSEKGRAETFMLIFVTFSTVGSAGSGLEVLLVASPATTPPVVPTATIRIVARTIFSFVNTNPAGVRVVNPSVASDTTAAGAPTA